MDSLSEIIDNDSSLVTTKFFDTANLSIDSSAPFMIYRIKRNAGHISKIESDGQGQCKIHMEYYFADGKVFKVIAQMYYSGLTTWDSILYYDKDLIIDQIARGNPLYGPYFKQRTDSLLKKFTR